MPGGYNYRTRAESDDGTVSLSANRTESTKNEMQMGNWAGKHRSNLISTPSTWPDGRLLGWRSKGFGVFFPNDGNENALICGLSRITVFPIPRNAHTASF